MFLWTFALNGEFKKRFCKKLELLLHMTTTFRLFLSSVSHAFFSWYFRCVISSSESFTVSGATRTHAIWESEGTIMRLISFLLVAVFVTGEWNSMYHLKWTLYLVNVFLHSCFTKHKKLKQSWNKNGTELSVFWKSSRLKMKWPKMRSEVFNCEIFFFDSHWTRKKFGQLQLRINPTSPRAQLEQNWNSDKMIFSWYQLTLRLLKNMGTLKIKCHSWNKD